MRIKRDIPTEVGTADSPTGPVKVLPYQIILNAKVNDSLEFPCVLDTGFSHDFCMNKETFDQWVRTRLKLVKYLRVGGELSQVLSCRLFIEGQELAIEGMAVTPGRYPRLPRGG